MPYTVPCNVTAGELQRFLLRADLDLPFQYRDRGCAPALGDQELRAQRSHAPSCARDDEGMRAIGAHAKDRFSVQQLHSALLTIVAHRQGGLRRQLRRRAVGQGHTLLLRRSRDPVRAPIGDGPAHQEQQHDDRGREPRQNLQALTPSLRLARQWSCTGRFGAGHRPVALPERRDLSPGVPMCGIAREPALPAIAHLGIVRRRIQPQKPVDGFTAQPLAVRCVVGWA